MLRNAISLFVTISSIPMFYQCLSDSIFKILKNYPCFSLEDIDECSGPNKCQQKCVNKPGNYSCDCHVGYRLNNDSITCSGALTIPYHSCVIDAVDPVVVQN